MRAVLQRVSHASVVVDNLTVGSIGPGLLVYAAAGPEDGPDDLAWMARKIAGLRIFEDQAGKMNLDVAAAGGAILLVSQFTLYADSRKGMRPAFNLAMEPQGAARIIEALAGQLRAAGLKVEEGRFGAHMEVSSLNNGPVTILLDSKNSF